MAYFILISVLIASGLIHTFDTDAIFSRIFLCFSFLAVFSSFLLYRDDGEDEAQGFYGWLVKHSYHALAFGYFCVSLESFCFGQYFEPSTLRSATLYGLGLAGVMTAFWCVSIRKDSNRHFRTLQVAVITGLCVGEWTGYFLGSNTPIKTLWVMSGATCMFYIAYYKRERSRFLNTENLKIAK